MFTPIHTCSHLSDYLRSWRNGSFSLNFPLRKLLFFYLTCSLVEIACFCSPNRELSNGVWLEQLYRKNINPSGSPYYSDHVRSSGNVIFCTFECSYSSVLCRILLKLHILIRLIECFPTVYGLWSCIEIEMSIPRGAHAKRQSIERGSSAIAL